MHSTSYGLSLRCANNIVQPIGAPPATYANPNVAGFSELVRQAALRELWPEGLRGSKTDAVATFESWLLLMYDGEFSLCAAHTVERGS